MSEGLRERFINALTATIELFDTINEDHAKRIAKTEDTILRLQGEIHEQQHKIDQLERICKQWLAERQEQAV